MKFQNINILGSGLPPTRLLNFIAHLFFLVYFAFAAYYYLERSLAFDGAWYCFKIALFGNLNIENGRWGVFYTQLLPLAALKFGASLKTFLFLYSVSYAIWNYIFYLIITRLFKNMFVGFSFVIALILFYRYSFFYPVSEIHSTIGPLFILAACIYKLYDVLRIDRDKAPLFAGLTIFLIYWLSQIHILSMLMVFFLFVYLLIDKKPRMKSHWLMYILLLLAVVYLLVKLSLIPKDSYDGSKLITLESVKLVLTNIELASGFSFFKKDLFSNYSITLVFIFATLISLLIQKNILKTFLIVTSAFGFFIIVMTYNFKPDSPLNYQNYNCYFGVIFALPIVSHFLFKFSKPFLFSFVFILLFFSYYRIAKSGLKLTDRTAYIQRTVENLRQFDEKKYIICGWNIPWSTIWTDWDFCYESLMMSSLNSPDSSLTFFTRIDLWEYDHYVNKDPKCFVGITYLPEWWQLSTDTIATSYFKPKEGYYRKVNSFQDSLFADTAFTKENIDILLKEKYSLLRLDNRQIEVQVLNNSNIYFNTYVTDDKTIWLSYHLYNKKGELLVAEGNRTNFEIDIPPNSSIKNGLTINLENIARGEYILEVDIVHENKRWFKINKRTNLIIY